MGIFRICILASALILTGCGGSSLTGGSAPSQPTQSVVGGGQVAQNSPDYKLGPGDNIQIFVWRSPELSANVPIRPDGRFSTPLIEDMQAANKTPTQLARDIEDKLRVYVQDPIVTVIVNSIGTVGAQNIKVLGQATQPQSLPYSSGMTVLDVLVAVGGLTEFADGNRSKLIRTVNGKRQTYRLRLGDLLNGDIGADRPVLPGDSIIIPESWF